MMPLNFSCLLATSVSSFENYMLISQVYWLISRAYLLTGLVGVWWVLCIVYISILRQISSKQRFSPILQAITSLNCSLAVQILVSWNHCVLFDFSTFPPVSNGYLVHTFKRISSLFAYVWGLSFCSIVSGKSRSYLIQTNLKQTPVGLIPYSAHWTNIPFIPFIWVFLDTPFLNIILSISCIHMKHYTKDIKVLFQPNVI